jgi:hypothetical protein
MDAPLSIGDAFAAERHHKKEESAQSVFPGLLAGDTHGTRKTHHKLRLGSGTFLLI